MQKRSLWKTIGIFLAVSLFSMAWMSGCGSKSAQTSQSTVSSSASSSDKATKEQERAEKERQKNIEENTLGKTPQELVEKYNAGLPSKMQDVKIISTSDDGIREAWHEYTGTTSVGDACKFTLTVPDGYEYADSFAYKGPWDNSFNQQVSTAVVSYVIPAVDPSLSDKEIGNIIKKVFNGDTTSKNGISYTASISGDNQIIFVAFKYSPYRKSVSKQKNGNDIQEQQETDGNRTSFSY